MSRQKTVFGFLVIVALSAAILVYARRYNKVTIEQWHCIDRSARIYPDYAEAVIPPNIAPLNFLIQEEGSRYYVKIHSKQDKPIEVFSKGPKIMIPVASWRKLLNANRGQELHFDIFVKKQTGQWYLFSTITNKIATDSIDDFLVYRKIHPVYSSWRKMGIYQRNLQNYNESLVLANDYCDECCLNCHTFLNNRTDKMLIGIRSGKYGSITLQTEGDQVNKIGTKFGYSSWHPSGRVVVYSINKVKQFFHTARNEVRDVIDLDSALVCYVIDSKTITIPPEISKKDRMETYPTWSPDGRYLYFCSAPILWSEGETKFPPERYDEVKYDLVRASYDIDRDQWGQPEIILAAEDTGMCILEPRISPDGRWLLFCMCDYGCFPVYQQSSDLYLMDLDAAKRTGQYNYRRLNINSDQSESWHSWSSNSRWIAFSSKRDYGVFTRTYLSYVDRQGRVCKPILLPQKDPEFYDSYPYTFSVPEFITEPVKIKAKRLGRAVRRQSNLDVKIPVTLATPKIDKNKSWQLRE